MFSVTRVRVFGALIGGTYVRVCGRGPSTAIQSVCADGHALVHTSWGASCWVPSVSAMGMGAG